MNGFAYKFKEAEKMINIKQEYARLLNKPNHCESFVAPWRGKSHCFVDSLRVLK